MKTLAIVLAAALAAVVFVPASAQPIVSANAYTKELGGQYERAAATAGKAALLEWTAKVRTLNMEAHNATTRAAETLERDDERRDEILRLRDTSIRAFRATNTSCGDFLGYLAGLEETGAVDASRLAALNATIKESFDAFTAFYVKVEMWCTHSETLATGYRKASREMIDAGKDLTGKIVDQEELFGRAARPEQEMGKRVEALEREIGLLESAHNEIRDKSTRKDTEYTDAVKAYREAVRVHNEEKDKPDTDAGRLESLKNGIVAAARAVGAANAELRDCEDRFQRSFARLVDRRTELMKLERDWNELVKQKTQATREMETLAARQLEVQVKGAMHDADADKHERWNAAVRRELGK